MPGVLVAGIGNVFMGDDGFEPEEGAFVSMDAPARSPVDARGMDPVRVLALAASLGAEPARVLLVGCEPAIVAAEDPTDVLVALSPAVEGAVEEAVALVESLARGYTKGAVE
jgi:hydrogenase maturation protease